MQPSAREYVTPVLSRVYFVDESPERSAAMPFPARLAEVGRRPSLDRNCVLARVSPVARDAYLKKSAETMA
jgi:hypothetical protein